jgi:hypothetical protein
MLRRGNEDDEPNHPIPRKDMTSTHLTIEKVAPGIRGHGLAQGLEVGEARHLFLFPSTPSPPRSGFEFCGVFEPGRWASGCVGMGMGMGMGCWGGVRVSG